MQTAVSTRIPDFSEFSQILQCPSPHAPATIRMRLKKPFRQMKLDVQNTVVKFGALW
jgi:hypothetical protein